MAGATGAHADGPAAALETERSRPAEGVSGPGGLTSSQAFDLSGVDVGTDVGVDVAPRRLNTTLLRQRPSAVLALQRAAGNRAVARVLGSRARPVPGRDATPAAGRDRVVTAPSAPAIDGVVQRAGPGGSKAKIFTFRGVDVSADGEAVRGQLERLVEHGGLKELRAWASAFLALDKTQKKAVAVGLDMSDGDIEAIDTTVSETNLKLEQDGRTFVDALRPSAIGITNGILDGSEKRIQDELDHYGIKEIPKEGTGGAEGAGPTGDNQITMENTAAAKDAQTRAKALAETRRTADKAGLAFTTLAQKAPPGMPELQKQLPEELQNAEFKEAEELWKMTEDLYAKQAMAATQEFPVVAMYASGDDAATKLDAFASQPAEQLGESIWREARTRLDNITKVRAELGDRYNPLLNKKILELTLGKEDVKAWQKVIAHDYVADIQGKADDDKFFWSTVAIGLGLLAALPTGGSSIAAGIGTAAAIAGAALSVYNAYEHWQEYQLQSATANTDFAKAQSISKDEPSFLWVAIDILGAGLEIGAAAIAFKSLVGVIKEARASKNVLKLAEAVDAVAPPACANKIKATVAGELGPEAVTEIVVAEGAKFRSGDLSKIRASLEQSAVEGWTEAYDAMAAQGKIKPLTEEALHASLSHIPARDTSRFRNMAEQYIYDYEVMKNQGIYSPETGIIFVKPGGAHTVGNVVAHEMVHAGQAAMGEVLNGFWAEFEAMSAQKRLILSLDKAGVGGQIEARVSWLRTATDNDIATFIESTLGYARPAKVGGFGGGDSQIARAAIEAAKRILAVGAL